MTFHAKADAWHAIINLNLVRSVTFLLCLLDKDSTVASAAKTSAPVAGSSSSSGSGSGVASFGMGFAGADDDNGEDGARPLLSSGPKLVPLCRLHVGFSLLCNIKLLEHIISPNTPRHLGGGSSGGAGASAGSMSSRSVESIHCMTGGIWSMPK
jgi:hypothetical protein